MLARWWLGPLGDLRRAHEHGGIEPVVVFVGLPGPHALWLWLGLGVVFLVCGVGGVGFGGVWFWGCLVSTG